MVEPTVVSKAKIEREQKKLRRKVAQAMNIISKAEDTTFESLTTPDQTRYLLVAHSGNGDEAD